MLFRYFNPFEVTHVISRFSCWVYELRPFKDAIRASDFAFCFYAVYVQLRLLTRRFSLLSLRVSAQPVIFRCTGIVIKESAACNAVLFVLCGCPG
jgi:hypothetical protein